MEGKEKKIGKIFSFDFDKEQTRVPSDNNSGPFPPQVQQRAHKRHSNNTMYKQSKLANVAAFCIFHKLAIFLCNSNL